MSKKNWIKGAVNPAHKGYCSPMTKSTCTPRRKALARTFKKMARNRKKADGGFIGSTFDDYIRRLIPKYARGSEGTDDPNYGMQGKLGAYAYDADTSGGTGETPKTNWSNVGNTLGDIGDILGTFGSLAGAGVNLAMAVKKRDTGVNQKGWDALSRMRQMNSRAMQMNNQAIGNRPQRYDVGPAREEINTAYNTAGYNLRNAGASPGSYQANMGALMTGKNMATDKLLAYQQNMEDQYRIGTSDAQMRASDAMRQSAAQEGTLGYYLSEADKQRQMGADAAGRSYWGQFGSDISNWSQMQQKMRGERGRDEELLALLKSGYYPNFNYDRPTGWGFNKQQG